MPLNQKYTIVMDLGNWLLRRKAISPDQLEMAQAVRKRHLEHSQWLSIAASLIETGSISKDTLAKTLRKERVQYVSPIAIEDGHSLLSIVTKPGEHFLFTVLQKALNCNAARINLRLDSEAVEGNFLVDGVEYPLEPVDSQTFIHALDRVAEMMKVSSTESKSGKTIGQLHLDCDARLVEIHIQLDTKDHVVSFRIQYPSNGSAVLATEQ
jgi:hypothetical protein